MLPLPLITSSGEVIDLRGLGVYRLLDSDGALLYVGQTSDVERRLQQHAATQEWWNEVAGFEWVSMGTRFEAKALERNSIEMDAPKHNKASVHPLEGVYRPLPSDLRARLSTVAQSQDADELNRWMKASHDAGWTLAAIGEAVVLTRERVRQRIAGVVVPEGYDVPKYEPPKPPRKVYPTITETERQELKDLQALATRLRGIHAPDHPYRIASEALSERLAEYKIRGVRNKDLAEALGVQAQTIAVRLKNHGYLQTSPSQTKYREKKHPYSDPQPKTHCSRGHELDGDNTRFINGDPKRVVCRKCERIRCRAYQQRKKNKQGRQVVA